MGEVKIEFRSDNKINKPGFLCYYERVTGTEFVSKYNVVCVCFGVGDNILTYLVKSELLLSHVNI